MTTPTSPRGESIERQWQMALEAGPSCLPLERLGETLTTAEQAHVAGCARCQTELEMFGAYEANTPVEGEGLAVAWISAQTKRRLAAAVPEALPATAPASRPAASPVRTWALPSWALMAASLAIVVGGAVLIYTPNRGIDAGGSGDAVYRGAQVAFSTPTGDVDIAPEQLGWTAVAGAVQYEVRLSEVDGTELWRVTTSSPAVSVPSSTRAAFLPAKTLVWRVDAKDSAGRIVATSGDTRVRVRLAGPGSQGR